MATSYKNLANFGSITPKFKKVKSVHPLDDQQFRYVCLAATLLDSVGISTEFCGAISRLHSLFHLFARGLHCYDARTTR